MPKRRRAAVIGTNTVGRTHVGVLSRLPNIELVAVCDLIPDRALAALDRAGQPAGVRIYSDQTEMHRMEELDLVCVATPSGDHLSPAMLAMAAGADVIVEKPIEIKLDRIDQMIATADRLGRNLAYISQNRWNDANAALKQAADEGRFGRIAWAGCFTPWYRPDQYYKDVDWRGTWALDGGGAIMNQSIHAIDLLQWIAGPIRQVSAFAASRIHPTIETEDTATASVVFDSGAFGTIVGSTAMYPGSAVRIEIGGENGTAVSENGLKTFHFRSAREDDTALVEQINATSAGQSRGARNNTDIATTLHEKNIAATLAAWDQGMDSPTSAREGRKSVEVVLALYESVRQGGKPVEVGVESLVN